MIGDALSHSALAGVGMGLILGFDPLIGMLAICVVAAFLIEIIRHKFPQYEMCIRDSYNIICLYVNFRL